jgi:DNA primase
MELPEFHVRAILDDADLSSPVGRDRALEEVAPVLASMGNTAEQAELRRQAESVLGLDSALVSERIRAALTGDANDTRVSQARPAPPQRAPHEGAPSRRLLTRHERIERALLAMCVASPADGREFLGRLTPDFLSSPPAARARDWLAAHLDDPLVGLPRDDEELVSLVTQIVMGAEREPGGRDAMELTYLQLEQAVIEGRIETARKEGGDPPVDLQRRRAELAERIAHFETAGASR